MSEAAWEGRRGWRGWALLAGVVAASFDAVFACGFWWLRNDVPPMRIFQSIAAGWLGPASFEGGASTAWIGAALHYFIAITMALVYAFAALAWPRLVNKPWSSGLIYGAMLYAAMTYVVVPLSRANPSAKLASWVIASIAAHLVIGVIIALIMRRGLR